MDACMHLCDIKFVSGVLQASKQEKNKEKGWPGCQLGVLFSCEILPGNSLAELVVPCMCLCASSAGGSELVTGSVS